MNKYLSFISEHTAEYVLVPKLKEILLNQFNQVIPIHFWLNREGNIYSKELHKKEEFKLLIFYPRRPKFIRGNEKSLFLKINSELLVHKNSEITQGVPIISGCPIIKSLWDLTRDTKCIWINLKKVKNEMHEYIIDSTLNIVRSKNNANELIDSDNSLVEYVNANCKLVNFEKLIEIVKSVRNTSDSSRFIYFGGYKPVFYLLKD